MASMAEITLARMRPAWNLCGLLREELDDDHTGDDEANAEPGGPVQFLAVDKNPQDGNQDHAHAGPDGVGDTQLEHGQRIAKRVKGDGIANDGDDAGHEFGEALGGAQGCAGGDFAENGNE